jgi:dipeptidyl aminopeptidase/acylaminoacyl peptidase
MSDRDGRERTESGSMGAEALVRAADVHHIATVSDPRVHPDGDRVAFVRTVPDDDETSEATVYVVDGDGDSDPRRFTVAEGVDSEPRWSPSGDRLAFVSTRGDDDRPQLWVVPTAGGEARQVTDVVGGVSSVGWSPDGKRLVFTQRVTEDDRAADRDLDVPEGYEPETPDPRVIDRTVYRAFERYTDGKRSQVYTVDLSNDTVERRTGNGATIERDFEAPEFGDEDTLYYATTPTDVDDPDDSVVFVVLARDLGVERDADGGEGDAAVETVVRTTGWVTSLSATADGRVAYPFTPEEKTAMRQTEIGVFDRTEGREHVPTAGLDRTLDYSTAPEFGPDGEYVYFLTPDEGSIPARRARWNATDADGVSVVAGGSHVSGVDAGSDPVEAVYTASAWNHPGDVYAVVDGETRRLTTVNADYLADRTVVEPESLSVEGPAGPLQGWLLMPPEAAVTERDDPDSTEGDGVTHPLVVEIHGGPHSMWTTAGTMWHEFQTLAARGYAVFWSNPRGSTGYGEDYAMAIDGDWGATTMADVEAGVDRVVARPEIDAEEVYLTGGSFGGFMTAWTVGHTDRYRAAVSQRGVYDLPAFYGTSDAYRLVEDDFDTTPHEDQAFLYERSPQAFAQDVETPTLLIHSEDDYRTPACTAEMFYRVLRKKGVDTRMVRYPREGHELSRSGEPAHVVDRIERIVRWFDGYSERFDVPVALDRARDEGLSAGED